MWSVVVVASLLVWVPLSHGLAKPICSTLVAPLGYPCEDHYPVTADGFILGMNRLPRPGKPPVLLQHGLLDCSATWLNNLPSESLGYILYDAGFDVWLGNSRGNDYSQRHTHLKPSQKAFWDLVDYDRMAQYDIPTMLDMVRNETHVSKVGYVGHSQGTIQMFAALSRNYGDVQSKVTTFIALAPVAFVHHQTAVLFTLLADLDAGKLLAILGVKEFLPDTKLMHDLGIACDLVPWGCKELLFTICGADPKNMNGSRIDYYTNWEPAGTSVRNMVHWSQGVKHEVFQEYDYGSKKENLAHYNQTTPPPYDLTKVNAPVALFSGGHDKLADPTDVATLQQQLPHVVGTDFQLPYEHLDFTWGLDCHVKIYPHVMQLLRAHAVEA